MRNIGLLLLLLLIPKITLGQEFPQTRISNEIIDALIYLPDKENGYYRATRFDWSGLIPELTYDGHSFFGKWFKIYDPKVHESVMGPVDAYAPIGYEQADIGSSFIKIGVGSLIKPDENDYAQFKTYEINDYGKWTISQKASKITFKHRLKNKGYAYKYKKSILLPKGKPEMVISYSLTNTGKQTIETEVYNHNFFFIDSMNIGPGYLVSFPSEITSNEKKDQGIGTLVELNENKIQYLKRLEGIEQVYLEKIRGSQKDISQYKITIENQNSGAGVKITGDKPLSRLSFWSAEKTICPEPYIHIEVDPGKTFTWQIHYEFYSLRPNRQF